MKKVLKTKVLVIVLLACLLAGVAGVVIYQITKPTKPDTEPTETQPTDTVVTDPTNPTEPTGPTNVVVDGKVEYVVNILSINGKPLSGFDVSLYDGNKEVYYSITDTTGSISIRLEPKVYDVIVSEEIGYTISGTYQTDLIGTPVNVICEPYLVDEEAEPTNRYTQGDVMFDFTVTASDGSDVRLYDLFYPEDGEGKEFVILNFWYRGCSYCIQEFPLMNSAYNGAYLDGKYSDVMEIVAVNSGADSMDTIKSYKESSGLSFIMAADYANEATSTALNDMFSVTGYPTTVVIDRYGTIDMIEVGAILSEDKWFELFDKYLDPNYQPQYIAVDENGNVVRPKPETTEIDDAALSVVKGEGFNATFRPEDNVNDKEYSWPWVLATKEGFEDAMIPSNSNQDLHGSFSMIYFDLDLKKDEALAFDYYASCETYDYLYIVVNGEISAKISGKSTEWEKNYCYVALKDGSYRFAFCYMKDSSTSMYDDTIYVKNLRIVNASEIDKETYLLREAAEGKVNPFTKQYETYAEVYLNEEDGYYHVGSVDGPILLLDLLGTTKWNSQEALYNMTLEATWLEYFPNGEYQEVIERYAQYANNSTLGFVPATEEIKEALVEVVKTLGEPQARDNENQWLELACYYSAYYADEMASPVVGVAPFDAIPFEKTNDEYYTTSAYIDRLVMPRGYIFKFTPEKSGVYRFTTDNTTSTIGWFCDEKGYALKGTTDGVRDAYIYATSATVNNPNFTGYQYYEAGKTYIVRAAFLELYEFNTVNLIMEYVGDNIEVLVSASDLTFSFEILGYDPETGEEIMGDTTAANYVNPVLGEDGYYYAVNNPDYGLDASISSNDTHLYLDFKYVTNGFEDYTLEELLDLGAFDMSKDEFNNNIFDEEGYLLAYVIDAEGNQVFEEDEDGNLIPVYARYEDENGNYIHQNDILDENNEPIYQDYTEYVRAYFADNALTNNPEDELYGLVLVDEKLANVMQLLMEKYTFAGVEDAWVRLCYYYQYNGSIN